MTDTTWVRLQASTRCLACTEVTAVNAAVDGLACVGCGAEFAIPEQLWDSALAEAREIAEQLDNNATTSRSFDAQGMTLNLAIAAVDATCPHCRQPWNALPERACPACATAVSVRAFAAGTLVGEDVHMLARERRELAPQTLSCSGCGAPLTAEGDTRKLECGACGRETVVPDEVWRRLHAPRAVASWYLYGGASRAPGLRGRLHAFDLAAGAGVVYAVGSHGDTPFALLALDTDPLGIRWMVDLESIGKARLMSLCAWADELFGYCEGLRTIEVFDAQTGAHLRTTTAPQPVINVAPDPDGTLVCQTMSGGRIRIDAEGREQPLWPKRGLFAGLFGARRLAEEAGGRLGVGLDGELRIVLGDKVGRVARSGEIRWSVPAPSVNVSIVTPVASPDGTTWAVFRTVGGTMSVEQMLAFTEAMVSGEEQSSSVLVRVGGDGEGMAAVRPSDQEEYTSLAVTAEGEVWLATGDGQLMRLDRDGQLLWRQAPLEDM
ncbi:hypothetical protein ENSA5_46770 [Enhygromyxa salina]|uniref:Uncharacterized protein n=1 Tax=Enhygromyxa salina TaxID=215803 RepID=A0A2S9XIZ3_9BACT|nr:hypothetical protein [Enhygromyxa salina]PRP92845.1 hypothetical protein ENSA5_46770 [Enhygromyxa salina]